MGKIVVLLSLVSMGLLNAHHALLNYDTTKPARVKGTVAGFYVMNPHSFVYVDEVDANGQLHRWAIEGPAVLQLNRAGFTKDSLKTGQSIEVCGYLPKEPITWQIASENQRVASLAGRLINGEELVLPGGKHQSWSDYGVHKCFAEGFKDHHN